MSKDMWFKAYERALNDESDPDTPEAQARAIAQADDHVASYWDYKWQQYKDERNELK